MEFSNIKTNTAAEILLEPRSVLVLSEEARWTWRHGIPGRRADLWQNRELPAVKTSLLDVQSGVPGVGER